MLELKHLCFEAETDEGVRQILKDVNLTVDERMVVITGPNGSGKSTFAKHVNGLLLPEDRPAGQFCPDAPLPRWEGARMAVRALGLEFPAAQASTCSPGFSDQAQFPAGTAG